MGYLKSPVKKTTKKDITDTPSISEMMAELDAIAAAQGIVWSGAEVTGTVLSERTRYAQPGQRCGTGYVRLLSARQVNFIKNLMRERDTTNLVRLPGSEDIEKMSLRGARDLIDRLRKCPELPKAQQPVKMATEPMVGFLRTLISRKGGVEPTVLTFEAVSSMIDELKVAPYPTREVTPTTTPLTPGLYRKGGVVVRVQKARTGSHLYGKVLDRDNGDAWIYTPGSIRGLTQDHRMTVQDAEELSLALGCCCMCSKTLTATVDGVPASQRTIGPVCATKV